MKIANAIVCVTLIVNLAFLSGCVGKKIAVLESFSESQNRAGFVSDDPQPVLENKSNDSKDRPKEGVESLKKESDSPDTLVSTDGPGVKAGTIAAAGSGKPTSLKQLSGETGTVQAGRSKPRKQLKPYRLGKAPAMTAFTDPRDKEGTLTFNFDDADLYDVIRVMADMLHFNYIVDPGVSGKVTIHTSGTLEPKDLLPLFHQILELNGIAAIQEDNLVKIVKAGDVAKMPATPLAGGGRIIQLVPLRYVQVGELTTLLKPFVTSTGMLVSDKASNLLIIVERQVNIPKLLKLVKVFDIDLFDNVNHRFYQLMNIEVEEAVKLLDQILAADGAKELYTFIPITRLNKILAICKKPRQFDKIDELIPVIDEENNLAEPQIYVYKVRNGQAEELSSLLKSIFTKKKQTKETAITKIQNTAAATGEKKRQIFPTSEPIKKKISTKAVISGTAGEGSGTLKDEVNFIPDEIRNAIIIEAIPSDYRLIKKILDQVDILPRQVLVEVVIADIRLTDDMQLGVEWAFDSEATSGADVITGSVGSSGLKFNVGWSDKIDAKLSAKVEAKDINVISTPRLLASDNKEASINITDQTPVATTTYENNDSNDGVFETDIQYKDTGIILSFTPHINDRGLVSMDISQEVSRVEDATNALGPTFSQRTVKTSLTVKDGQTIVIGGLMSESDSKSNSGVPFLAKLPVIGFLFGTDSNSQDKTELIILIKPTVIKDLDDIDDVTREFKERVSSVATKIDERIQPNDQ